MRASAGINQAASSRAGSVQAGNRSAGASNRVNKRVNSRVSSRAKANSLGRNRADSSLARVNSQVSNRAKANRAGNSRDSNRDKETRVALNREVINLATGRLAVNTGRREIRIMAGCRTRWLVKRSATWANFARSFGTTRNSPAKCRI